MSCSRVTAEKCCTEAFSAHEYVDGCCAEAGETNELAKGIKYVKSKAVYDCYITLFTNHL